MGSRSAFAESPHQESIFHPHALDLISSEFASNLSYYRNYEQDDELARLFLGHLMDLIDCTFYTARKSRAETRKKIADTLSEFYSPQARESHLMGEIMNPLQAAGIVEENGLILDSLRGKYQSLVRGPFRRCWQETTRSVAADLDECCARNDGCAVRDEGGEVTTREQCSRYFSAWRRSVLALPNREELRSDPAGLAEAIRERCRLLSLLAVPDRLEEFLSPGCWQHPRGGEGERTVRGVIVRILSMLADECFTGINRIMNLPPDQSFYLASPPG